MPIKNKSIKRRSIKKINKRRNINKSIKKGGKSPNIEHRLIKFVNKVEKEISKVEKEISKVEKEKKKPTKKEITPIKTAKDTPKKESKTVEKISKKGYSCFQISSKENFPIPPGWEGGFVESNPNFAYPNPKLESLPMLNNMVSIDKLQRCQIVEWPEFSWETKIGKKYSRCYQKFASEISRMGYTNEGRVYSVICPQQGFVTPDYGSLNVEVTVTKNRGWVNEINNDFAVDIEVEGRIWFASSALTKSFVKTTMWLFGLAGYPFPFNKENAIRIKTCNHKTKKPAFPLRKGQSTRFDIPDFAKHTDTSWSVGNLEVEIGQIVKCKDYPIVNAFNKLVMSGFNMASGNMLKKGNVLAWNVWFTHPIVVDQEEWREHAQKWRDSIQADHGSPHGDAGKVRYFDGTAVIPLESFTKEQEKKNIAAIKKQKDKDDTEGKIDVSLIKDEGKIDASLIKEKQKEKDKIDVSLIKQKKKEEKEIDVFIKRHLEGKKLNKILNDINTQKQKENDKIDASLIKKKKKEEKEIRVLIKKDLKGIKSKKIRKQEKNYYFSL